MNIKGELGNELEINEQERISNFSMVPTPIKIDGHEDQVYCLALSYDGTIIATGSADQTQKIWETESKRLLWTIKTDFVVYNLTISSNNMYLAFIGTENIVIYKLKQKQVAWYLKDCQKFRGFCCFNQDSNFLLYGTENGKLFVWSVMQKKQISQFKTEQGIRKIIMSPDNKLISCITLLDARINIWNFQTKCLLINKCTNQVYGFDLSSSADSSMFISSGSEGLIQIWKFEESNCQFQLTLSKQIYAAQNNIENIILTSDKQYIISSCDRQLTIMIHEVDSGNSVQVLDQGTSFSWFSHISLSNDMRTLVSSHCSNNFLIWTRK